MTIACFDSSAFVKLLVDEEGSEDAEQVWNDTEAVVASRLALPEVSAALAMARRAGRLDEAAERIARRVWAEYWAATRVMELSADIATEAAALVRRLVVGGADAVHLATALTMAALDPIVVTWDRRLGEAALASGLAVLPGGF